MIFDSGASIVRYQSAAVQVESGATRHPRVEPFALDTTSVDVLLVVASSGAADGVLWS